MKKVLAYIKDNLITGAIIIIPLVIIGIIIVEVVKKLIALTAPFTDKMDLGGPLSRAIVATIIVAVVFGTFIFIIGLIAKSYVGSEFRNWMEKNVYVKIPFYNTFLGVARQITGKEKKTIRW